VQNEGEGILLASGVDGLGGFYRRWSLRQLLSPSGRCAGTRGASESVGKRKGGGEALRCCGCPFGRAGWFKWWVFEILLECLVGGWANTFGTGIDRDGAGATGGAEL